MDNLFFAVVIFRLAHDPSVGNNRSSLDYLQAARLVQHNTGVFGAACLPEFSIIITDDSKQCALRNHVSRFRRRIPQAAFRSRLIADIRHFHRHVVPHIAADLIHPEAA